MSQWAMAIARGVDTGVTISRHALLRTIRRSDRI
jgi:hypothetical protein